ncbi:MAG: hypothetical protein ACLQU2_16805 [Candidatus Binataceae bacterium]
MSDDWIKKIAPMDSLAFHGPAAEYAMSVAPQTEGDPVGILVEVLVLFGNMIGRTVRYVVGATEHYTNLYVLIIGTTSRGRKGTAFDLARLPYRGADQAWYLRCFARDVSSGEGLIHRVRDPVMKPGSDELLDEGVQDKRLVVTSSEFSGFLKVMKRDGNILAEQVCQAWETGDLGVLTKNRNEFATGALISIAGHITPRALGIHFDSEQAAPGFGNRFLFFRVGATRLLPDGGNLTIISAASAEFAEAAKAAVRQLKFGTMLWSEDAREVWKISYLTTLNIEQPGMFGELTSRAAPQVARLSMIFAALDCSPMVELPHVLASLAVLDFSVRTTRAAFGDLIGVADADAILGALRAQPEGMTRKNINDFFSRNFSSARIEAAPQILQRDGLSTFERVKEGAFRPTEIWRAVIKTPAPTPDYLGPFKTKAWRKKLDEANARMAVLRANARVMTNEVSVNDQPLS